MSEQDKLRELDRQIAERVMGWEPVNGQVLVYRVVEDAQPAAKEE